MPPFVSFLQAESSKFSSAAYTFIARGLHSPHCSVKFLLKIIDAEDEKIGDKINDLLQNVCIMYWNLVDAESRLVLIGFATEMLGKSNNI